MSDVERKIDYTEEEEQYLDSHNELRSVSIDSDRPSSPSPSLTPSTYTYSSSVDGQTLLRDIHGRAINATSESYMLPADKAEHDRLDLQHELFKRKIGGLYFKTDAVRRALAPKQDVQPTIIDIGTGAGTWATDMARHFPHVQVTGLDLAPANLVSPPPPNCKFECDDANLGLGHYRNSFNVVHARMIATGITGYRALLSDIANMLRPEGVYLSIEVDMQLYNENFEAITATDENDPSFTWLQKVMFRVYNACKERTPGGIDAGYLIPSWLKSMDCWKDFGDRKMYIPIGAWEPEMSDKQRQIAEMMMHDTIVFMNSVRPMLLAHGYFEETVDQWLAKAIDELKHVRKKQYWRFHCAWAVKKSDPSNQGVGAETST
ncbi:hypothetical protein FRB94_002183 [Tulasnella sp. JGI-2019a]|nr:hypothetical protein FRB93_003946 [Tulasnella sp. JGI-2019a]KAG9004643.1 hypothetical protein FRB94_002183 [Tulasnella sp. JGI-2019a]KAG9029514.1 hypothetical protein FRB95_005235 [Tulasnella sp. JGI-2019a]